MKFLKLSKERQNLHDNLQLCDNDIAVDFEKDDDAEVQELEYRQACKDFQDSVKTLLKFGLKQDRLIKEINKIGE